MSVPENPQNTAVEKWLEGIGMGQYAAAFNENDLDPDMLDAVTDADLKECGVSSLGHRKKILVAIHARKSAAGPPTSLPVSGTGKQGKLSTETGVIARPPTAPLQTGGVNRRVRVATGELAAADPSPEQPPSKRGFWAKMAGSKILVISIILHVLFAAAATLWIVQRIQAKRKLSFQGGPGPTNPSTRSLEHKINMSRKQQTMSAPAQAKRITTTGVSRISLPDMPSLPSANDLTPNKMGGMGGTGMAFGAPGGGGGGGGGSGKGLTMFGMRGGGEGLPGTLYDFKQNRDGKATGMDRTKYTTTVYDYVRGGWQESNLQQFFRAPITLYAAQIMTPELDANEGPKAFGVEKEIKPNFWVIHYKGRVSPPESGKYYFVGAGDDVMIVRFNGRVVLDRCWEPQLQKKKPLCNNTANYDYGWIKIPNGFARGEPFDAIVGQSYDVDILIGEQPGGWMSAALLIEKDGAIYQRDGKGNPILPVFRVTGQAPPPSDQHHATAPHMMDGPVWQLKNSGGFGNSLGF